MITLICHQNSIRLQYVVDYLTHRLGITISVQLYKSGYKRANDPVINYTDQPIPNCFSIYNEGFLFEKDLREKNQLPHVKTTDTLVQLFPANTDEYSINFDMFSAIFFCLSRYEEYLPFSTDEHGRFTGQQSHAFKHHYLKVPVVDFWINYFITFLNEHTNLDLKKTTRFHIKPTIDVDSAWAYQNKSQSHRLVSIVKNLINLDWDIIKDKREVLKGKIDPYDTFEYLKNSLNDKNPIYFFLMNVKRPYDTAYYVELDAFHLLLKSIDDNSEIGIHPSYESYDNPSKIKIEKDKLEKITERQIVKSRQHFLRLNFPETYNQLILNGILEDYSMGYADQIGFRAGTSLPFRFYNVDKEEVTDLMVQPFCIMDVTLKQYHDYSIEEAMIEVKTMKNTIKESNGCLSFIWHNSSFAEFEGWAGWDKVFQEIIKD